MPKLTSCISPSNYFWPPREVGFALHTDRLAFAGLRHGCADNARDGSDYLAHIHEFANSIRMGNYLAVDNLARNSIGTCIRYKK